MLFSIPLRCSQKQLQQLKKTVRCSTLIAAGSINDNTLIPHLIWLLIQSKLIVPVVIFIQLSFNVLSKKEVFSWNTISHKDQIINLLVDFHMALVDVFFHENTSSKLHLILEFQIIPLIFQVSMPQVDEDVKACICIIVSCFPQASHQLYQL